jgi:hypothetical protein
MSDGYPSFIMRTDEEAADLVLEWMRLKLADAYDQGVSIAGRYGHEDYWDSENSPYIDNPWRTREELIENGWEVE